MTFSGGLIGRREEVQSDNAQRANRGDAEPFRLKWREKARAVCKAAEPPAVRLRVHVRTVRWSTPTMPREPDG